MRCGDSEVARIELAMHSHMRFKSALGCIWRVDIAGRVFKLNPHAMSKVYLFVLVQVSSCFIPTCLAQSLEIRSARPISTSPQQTHREAEEFRPVGGHRQPQHLLRPWYGLGRAWVRTSTERMEKRAPTPEWCASTMSKFAGMLKMIC